jgi:uncharacterized protein YciI
MLSSLALALPFCTTHDMKFLVFLHSNPGKAEISTDSVQALQKAHIENIEKLSASGDLIAAGPFEGGGGLFVILARDTLELERILASDPAIRAGRFIIEYSPVKEFAGSVCGVDFLYTMEIYDFVRISFPEEVTNRKIKAVKREFNNVPAKILWGARFSKYPDIIMVLHSPENSLTESQLRNLPSLSGSTTRINVSRLYIAKETFCN